MELRHAALHALRLADPPAKVAAVHALWQAAAGNAPLEPSVEIAEPDDCPGRPPRPALVDPAQVPRRSPHTTAGRAALLHAIAHIEFNAINLALDAVWRFAGLPAAYYRDWLRVADEEALHFTLLREHLRALGHDYGDFDAHDGLWAMAEKTRHDLVARMALVPRTLEARGLDATPAIQRKLAAAGDARGRDPRRDPARRDRPCRDRQPLVPLGLRARGARAGRALRRAGPPPRGAAARAAVQPEFGSWTRPGGPSSAALARRDDAAGSCPQGGATPPAWSRAARAGA